MKTFDWEDWIDTGVNSWISVAENGDEFLNEDDIVELKTRLTKNYRELLKNKEEEMIRDTDIFICKWLKNHTNTPLQDRKDPFWEVTELRKGLIEALKDK